MTLHEPSPIELDTTKKIRDAVLREVRSAGMSLQDLANKLGLLPTGAETLLARTHWPLDVAFRVAEALSLDISVDVKRAR